MTWRALIFLLLLLPSCRHEARDAPPAQVPIAATRIQDDIALQEEAYLLKQILGAQKNNSRDSSPLQCRSESWRRIGFTCWRITLAAQKAQTLYDRYAKCRSSAAMISECDGLANRFERAIAEELAAISSGSCQDSRTMPGWRICREPATRVLDKRGGSK